MLEKEKIKDENHDKRRYALNFGRLEVPTDIIASALEIDETIVEKWLVAEGIMPNKRQKELRRRQAEGIAAARSKGVRFGRPKTKIPENFEVIVKAWEDKKISAVDAMEMCGLKAATFYRRVKEYRMSKKEKSGLR